VAVPQVRPRKDRDNARRQPVVSAQDFIVTTAGAPTISAFTPASGGRHLGDGRRYEFQPAAGATTVKVNQTRQLPVTSTGLRLPFPRRPVPVEFE
jgi:hypothetical protein